MGRRLNVIKMRVKERYAIWMTIGIRVAKRLKGRNLIEML
jgi:hypothetical protein